MTWKSTISLVVKILVSTVAIGFVLRKVSLPHLLSMLESVSFSWMALAFLLFVFSKLFSVARLQCLFREANLPVEWTLNAKLYWLGMFYNQFLPGGVGGDVYKTIWLSRHFVRGKVEMAKLVFWDRISGLIALLALLLVMTGAWFSFSTSILGLLLAVCMYIVYVWITYKRQWRLDTLLSIEGYSFLVQISQLASAYCLMCALHIQAQPLSYLVLFLFSSLASVAPLTLGGIGAREFTFMMGTGYLATNVELSISIGFLFYLISLVASIGGVVYLFLPLVAHKEKLSPLTPLP